MKELPKNLKVQVVNFFQEQKKFKRSKAEFEKSKSEFYESMSNYFGPCDTEIKFDCKNKDELSDSGGKYFVVKKLVRSTVEFDSAKLAKSLTGLGFCLDDIILKRYEVSDMKGLISYLKECNVNPSIFKSFLTVSSSVNSQELNRLEEIGKLSLDDIKGCYPVS